MYCKNVYVYNECLEYLPSGSFVLRALSFLFITYFPLSGFRSHLISSNHSSSDEICVLFCSIQLKPKLVCVCVSLHYIMSAVMMRLKHGIMAPGGSRAGGCCVRCELMCSCQIAQKTIVHTLHSTQPSGASPSSNPLTSDKNCHVIIISSSFRKPQHIYIYKCSLLFFLHSNGKKPPCSLI